MNEQQPPDGFVVDGSDLEHGKAESWYQLVGPLYHDGYNTPGNVRLAFYAERRYISSMNRVHGGKMSSFMDYLLFGTARSAWDGAALATVSLNINFISACPPDVWVIGYGSIVRAGKNMAFTTGEARVGEKVIVQATGTFRKL
ncbi:MAG: PaaI family thioesterase [Candidatus Marinimicrobia bacterium]|nr:PaaI family thioesterase [Candidatus Neomarinimicrobiota bacterium]